MLEAYGDIWDLAPDYDAVVITTNGYVKKNGEAVLGRGIAKEAKERFPRFAFDLGVAIQKNGNYPMAVGYEGTEHWVLTLPVKPIVGPSGEPGWKVSADIELITSSIPKMIEIIDRINTIGDYPITKIIMPRPGCGNGKLKWEDVKPVIEPLLDDRFTVVTFHP